VTVGVTEEITAGLIDRRFDLGLITLPVSEEHLKILPLFEEELPLLRPSPTPVRGGHVGSMRASELAGVPFLLYPKQSNMGSIIDQFFAKIGVTPRVLMEADDTEAIKRLVESGFGYSMLPEHALRGQTRFFHTLRIAGHQLTRRQALAMAAVRRAWRVFEEIRTAMTSAAPGQGRQMAPASRQTPQTTSRRPIPHDHQSYLEFL